MDDCEVPEYLAGLVAGTGEAWPRVHHDDYYFTYVNELLELLRHGDDVDGGGGGAGSSAAAHGSVSEKPSLDLPLPTNAANMVRQSPPAGEAEMASWLCQVFFEEASDAAHDQPRRTAAPATTTTNTGGSTSTHGVAAGGDAADKAAECCRGQRRRRPLSGGRRSCAAERRRRDKINDKMRTLQQLVPTCSKADKASTLEEVIQYVKSLQHQLKVLSNSYAMPAAPILPPGVVPPPCMHPASAGDIFGGQPAVMLPRYPFVPAVFACPHHWPPPPPPPLSYRRSAGPAAAQQSVHRRHPVPNNLAVPRATRKQMHP